MFQRTVAVRRPTQSGRRRATRPGSQSWVAGKVRRAAGRPSSRIHTLRLPSRLVIDRDGEPAAVWRDAELRRSVRRRPRARGPGRPCLSSEETAAAERPRAHTSARRGTRRRSRRRRRSSPPPRCGRREPLPLRAAPAPRCMAARRAFPCAQIAGSPAARIAPSTAWGTTAIGGASSEPRYARSRRSGRFARRRRNAVRPGETAESAASSRHAGRGRAARRAAAALRPRRSAGCRSDSNRR